MSTVPSINRKTIEYPTTDGKPMAETEQHRDVMIDTIQTLQFWFADDPKMYVSGNLLMYYVAGDKRKHVSPDVFVVRGVAKDRKRLNYLIWEEKKSPSMITEITSKTTRKEDTTTKFALYRDVLKVKEYFQFDPLGEYLNPPLQGFRLHKGDYVPIAMVDGRLPSKVVNLHLEANGANLQWYDPVAQKWIPLPVKAETDRANAAEELAKTEAERANAEAERASVAENRAKTEAERAAQMEREKNVMAEEMKRLREEMEKSRRQKDA